MMDLSLYKWFPIILSIRIYCFWYQYLASTNQNYLKSFFKVTLKTYVISLVIIFHTTDFFNQNISLLTKITTYPLAVEWSGTHVDAEMFCEFSCIDAMYRTTIF